MKKLSIRLALAILLLSFIPQNAQAARLLVPGGQVVGLELHNDTLTVVDFEADSPAADKLKRGDCLVSLNGQTITQPEDIRNGLLKSSGTVSLTVRRGEKLHTIKIKPTITESGPKLGIYLRQGITGIGTVTWYDPDTGDFGTLGHGVNDSAGHLIALKSGNVYSATVASVRKGRCGDPGQLMGSLRSPAALGSLTKNTAQGVFGKLDSPISATRLPADSSCVQTGSATILSTVEGTAVREYSVEILKVYPSSRQTGRNMLIKVTDPALLSITGGIVQGMSGSPIIQNGRLIGAVTHVLVNDPTTGYGIFIENMLDAAA